MKFFKCFWIPERQAVIVGICLLFVILPITLIGILIKSISILLSLFFIVSITCGGFGIYKEQRRLRKFQRESVYRAGTVKVEILARSAKSYQLKAMTRDYLIIYDQEYRSMNQVMSEIQYWVKQRPTLKYTIEQSFEGEVCRLS